MSAETALACVRLALQDADRARELAGAEGQALRAAAERYARCAISGEMAEARPWTELLAAVRARGEAAGTELEALAAAELELTSRKDRKRVETEWSERIRRSRRRVQTGALDLGLQLVSLWFADLACLAYGAGELVRNCDRADELEADAGARPGATATGHRAGGGHSGAVLAQRVRGSGMRGPGVPPAAAPCADERGRARVPARAGTL